MARTGGVGPCLKPAPGSRPQELFRGIPGVAWEDLFRAEIDNISADQIDNDSVILVPSDYRDQQCCGVHLQEYEHLSLKTETTTDVSRVWKTTVMYEQFSESHPRLVPFKGRDPWTGFPILAKPSGPPLDVFIDRHRSIMYSPPVVPGLDATRRILPQYRPLIFQWALHLISGLRFIHSHSIVYGDFTTDRCWLSQPGLALSLVGFLDAGLLDGAGPRAAAAGGWNASGWYFTGNPANHNLDFHPLHVPRWKAPTIQADLFLWGCLIYELMTGCWPGDGLGKSSAEIQQMLMTRQWPTLEENYLGRNVRKCWDGLYADVGTLMEDLVLAVRAEGFEVDGDEIRGVHFDDLFQMN